MTHTHQQLRLHHHTTLTRWVGWLLVWWVITLTILNPLACLLYCEMLHAHDIHSHNDTSLYVCDMAHTSSSATLTDALAGAFSPIPLPIYPGLLILWAGLFVYLASQHRIWSAVHPLCSHPQRPTSPPPKQLSFV